MRNWTKTVDKRPGAQAIHFGHPMHGTVSVHQIGPSEYHVRHGGGNAGLLGQKGIFNNPRDAIVHAVKYMAALPADKGHTNMYNIDPTKPPVNKEEIPSTAPVGDPSQPRPSPTPSAGPKLDPQKVKQFQRGFFGALGGTSKTEKYFEELLIKADEKRKDNAIRQADETVKPLMVDVQKGFNAIKQQIQSAAAKPTIPANKAIMDKYSVSIGKKGEIKADNHRIMRHAVEAEWKKDPSRFIPRITVDNSKLKNEAIGAWTTPAIATCPGARDCKAFCFAKNDQVQYKNSLAKRFVNMYARKNPEFEHYINNQLVALRGKKEEHVKDWEKPVGTKINSKGREVPAGYAPALDSEGRPISRKWDTFRIHDSGDFDTPEYTDTWRRIIEKNPDVKFYAYTKSYSHPEIWKRLQAMHAQIPNFKVIQSLGGVNEKVNPVLPHAVIFENNDQLKRSGYVGASNFDSLAADKNNRDVGLVIFGGGRKKYGNLKEHLKTAHGVRHKLASESGLHPTEYEPPAVPMPENLKRSETLPIPRELDHTLPDSDEAEQTLQPDHYAQERIHSLNLSTMHPFRRLKYT